MRLIPCPMNGLRPENEFITGAEIRPLPDAGADASVWADYLFMNDNPAGEVWEWWCHTPSGFWFAMRRDTRTDACLETLSVADAVQQFGL